VTVPAPWLTPEDVAAWLKLSPAPPVGSPEYALLTICAGSAEDTAERYRADCFDTSGTAPVFVPTDEVRAAATALAGRLYRRRNSPAGIETFADSTLYVSRFDPEVERGLHMAGYLVPNRSFGGTP
jgi:hypothetical protein